MSIDSIISLILTDKRLSALRKKIVSGKGTFSDTFDYTSYSANLMGRLFSGEVLDMPEEERKSTCISLLRDRYTDINALLDTTQRALDKAQGLALAPRHVPFDEERAAQIGDSLTDKTVPDETIVRRAGSAPVTAVRSMHDDYIEENAEFRSKAGLQCYINRVTDGKCCKWCSKMAGRFEYGDEPDGIFRRHDNCGCSVTYECGRQRQNVWTKKTWEVPETDAGAPPPTVLSHEQACRLEREKLAQIVHKPSIDKLGESGIMKAITVDDFELRTYGQGIQKDVEKVMLSEIRQVEKRCGVVISDIRIEEMSDSTKGREAIVTEILPNGLLCMHFNKAIFSNLSLDEIDQIFASSDSILANNFKEAMIHESGHVKYMKGRTAQEVNKIHEELKNINIKGLSKYAETDGAECLAETELMLSLGGKVPDEAMKLYKKYILRE